jgi:3-isopropylmalate dehydrogenase
VARVAFDLAKKRKNKVTSCEKSNVMEAGILWREEVQALKDKEYKKIELSPYVSRQLCNAVIERSKAI